MVTGTTFQREKEEQSREEARKTIPHFWNLNEDPQLTSMIMHFCPPGKSRVGNKKANPPAQIQLNGLRYCTHIWNVYSSFCLAYSKNMQW